MTRDVLLKLAAKVGLPRYDKMQLSGTPRELQRLVDAAVADEREACASIADQYSAPIVAGAIRKRGAA